MFNAFKTSKLAKKNDTQPKQGGGQMLPHFPLESHLEQQKIKNYFLLDNLNELSNCLHVQYQPTYLFGPHLPTCPILMLPTYSFKQ